MSSRSLDEIRAGIDEIDDRIVDLLAERFRLVSEVAQLKKASKSEVYQPGREAKILDRVVSRGRAQGLNPLLLQALFIQIFAVSKKEQI